MRKLLCVILFSLCFGSSWGQSDATQVQVEVPTLEAAWEPVTVDHIFGLRGGYGGGFMRREPTVESVSIFGCLNLGASYKLDILAQKYVGCIEFDLQYMEKSFSYLIRFDRDEVYERRYSVVELPILWQPYFPLSGRGGRPTESRIFLNAGPYLAYALESWERVYNKQTGAVLREGRYAYDPLRDNRVEYGVVVGGGFVVGVGRFGIAMDFRYNIMLSDVLKGVHNYSGNPFRSPVDQMNLSLGVQYRIKGKKR